MGSCHRRVTGRLPNCWRILRQRGKCWKSCGRRGSGWKGRAGTYRSRLGGRRRGKFWPVPPGIRFHRQQSPRQNPSRRLVEPAAGQPDGCPGDGRCVHRSGRLGRRRVWCCWLGVVCGGGFSARQRRTNWRSQRWLKLQRRQLPNRQRHRFRQRPGRATRPIRYGPARRHRLAALRHGRKTRLRRRWKGRSRRTNQSNRNPQPPRLQ